MKSRTRKRLILIIILAVIFIALILNIYKIKFALNMLNIYIEEKNIKTTTDNTVNNIPNPIKNPLTEIIQSEVIEEEGIKNPENKSKEDSEDDTEDVVKSPSVSPVENKANPSTSKGTIKSYLFIVKGYNHKLEILRDSFELELDQLITKGIEEYKSHQISTAGLSAKYLKEGSSLEKSSDEKFNSLIKDMEKELKLNNYDIKIIQEIKNYYREFKDTKKYNIISKGMKYLK